MSWQRINVIGTSGSGKTTLARELARRLSRAERALFLESVRGATVRAPA